MIPEHAEVANALGAITGNTIEIVEVLIEPVYSPAGIACYTVHSPEEKIDFDNLASAAAYAQSAAKRLVKQKATHAGAGQQVEIQIERSDQTATANEGRGKSTDFLLASRIRATAISKPDVFSGSLPQDDEPERSY